MRINHVWVEGLRSLILGEDSMARLLFGMHHGESREAGATVL